jgi:short-subunit dehydrogenase
VLGTDETDAGAGAATGRRVMLVTGASSGIGEATARLLGREPGAVIVVVARREERLRALVDELPRGSSFVAVDLLDADAPARVRAHVEDSYGALHLLVNNAGAAWRARFAEGGWENVRRTMAINFDAPVRLTETLLPLLRASAPSAIVNVASTAARLARPGTGAYSAAKFALAGWSDSLFAEERPHGVHVGVVLPGFIATEGFPQRELTGSSRTRWAVSTPQRAAEAIRDAGLGGRPERYVPRPYALAGVLRILTPGLYRRIVTGPAASQLAPATAPGPGADVEAEPGRAASGAGRSPAPPSR